MAIVLQLDETVTVDFVAADDKGEALVFETPPTWISDSALQIMPDADGMSAQVKPISKGWTQLTIKGRAVSPHNNPILGQTGATMYTGTLDLIIKSDSPDEPWLLAATYQVVFGLGDRRQVVRKATTG